MHFDRDGIGLGWRWRLHELLLRFDGVLTREDIAWSLSHGNARRRVDKGDGVPKLEHFLSSGTGRIRNEQVERLLDYLKGQMGAVDASCLTRRCETLDEFRGHIKDFQLQRAKPIAPRIELDALDDMGRPARDDRSQRLASDVWRFLSPLPSQDNGSAAQPKPVFMLYAEHNRAMQSFVRHLVSCFADSDPLVRSVITINAREHDGRLLALTLLGESPDHCDVDDHPAALASAVKTRLDQQPAVVVVTHFDPILVSLSGAAMYAACRNNGMYDMLSRIIHTVSPATRFILLVNRRLTRVDASYLHDVRLFTQPERAACQVTPDYLNKVLGHSRFNGATLRQLCDGCASAQRQPGDTLLSVLAIALSLDPTLSREWVRSVINQNARREAVRACLQAITEPAVQSCVLITALAEDRLEVTTLNRTLQQVGGCPGLTPSARNLPTQISSAEIEQAHQRTIDALPGLVYEVKVEERDLGHSRATALDMDSDFRRLVIDLLEQPGTPTVALTWSRQVRLAIGAKARDDHDQIMIRHPEASPERNPALFRRAILTTMLVLGAVDPIKLQRESEARDKLPASLGQDALDNPNASAGDLVRWCYDFIERLEHGPQPHRSYHLSASYAGHQLKLQLWLCFQHPGFSRPQGGVRGPERPGPSLSPPNSVASLSVEQNLEMFASLAVAAFGTHELEYCDMVLRATDSYIATLNKPLQSPGMALRITKMWKRQCDLLIRRGQLEEAEQFIRHRLREVRFFAWFPVSAYHHRLPSEDDEPCLGEHPTHILRPPLVFPVWSRLLGRLGEVLRLRGAARRHEALEAFELAERFDDAFATYASAKLPTTVKRGLSGRAARCMLRLLCADVRNQHFNREHRTESAKDTLRRVIAVQRDLLADGAVNPLQSSIDAAIQQFSKTIVGESRANWLAAAEVASSLLNEAQGKLHGRRLPGIELAHIPNARAVLLAQALAHYSPNRFNLLGATQRQRLNKLARQVQQDAQRVIELVSTHDTFTIGTPWRYSNAPLFALDASLAALVTRCFVRAHHTRLDGRRMNRTKLAAFDLDLTREFALLRAGLHKTGYYMRIDLLRGAQTLAECFHLPSLVPIDNQVTSKTMDKIFGAN